MFSTRNANEEVDLSAILSILTTFTTLTLHMSASSLWYHEYSRDELPTARTIQTLADQLPIQDNRHILSRILTYVKNRLGYAVRATQPLYIMPYSTLISHSPQPVWVTTQQLASILVAF